MTNADAQFHAAFERISALEVRLAKAEQRVRDLILLVIVMIGGGMINAIIH